MTPDEMKVFIDFLQKNLDIKEKELELFNTFPAKFIELGLLDHVLPAQNTAEEMQKAVSKLTRQISLLKDPSVETMDDEQFREYINS